MKTTLLLFLFTLALASPGCAQEPTYQLSSHILDITKGQPAANVKISLSKQDASGAWATIEEKTTDANGRIPDFLKNAKGVDNKGIYKLTYFTAPYFKSLGEDSFYPFIEVVFEIKDGNHYHVPITLSPYGYSTYRGN
ncbi:MAG: hydroxyisourate hydrolase [Flavobacteriales bacterium]|nr:hydroxyisourate hydrolase [Flavobacteriales bacterium]